MSYELLSGTLRGIFMGRSRCSLAAFGGKVRSADYKKSSRSDTD